MRADFIVKSVIILLIAASVYSWTLIFEKYKVFKKINNSSSIFEEQFLQSTSVKSLYDKTDADSGDPLTNVFRAGVEYMNEHKSKAGNLLAEKTKAMMGVAIDKEIEKYEDKLTFLATVGSVAPFIGLFGTVWGIMNSFQSIAISRNTSLAIVAPGIAEALFATALGLLAAIPAVVAYNRFISSSRKFTQKLENFSQTFVSLI
jgi:biopolymer transport protein TolQ